MTSFDSILTQATTDLSQREAENNKWLKADGTPCTNYIWKYASKTKQGDAGENVVKDVLMVMLTEAYGEGVTVDVVNMGKGDFDVQATLPTGRVITFEVKTATEDVNGCHQFNGLKKTIAYDFAFLFGVAPEGFYFNIATHAHLCKVMTTNMSKSVVGAYKYTLKQSKLDVLTPDNLRASLTTNGII
jgi:hypothetical protein